MPDYSFAFQPVHGSDRLFLRHIRIHLMDQIKIDVIGSEPFQAGFGGPENVVVTEMCFPDLVGQEIIGTSDSLPFHCDSHQFFGVTARIHFGGIDMTQACCDAASDCGDIGVIVCGIRRIHATHAPGPLPQNRNRKTVFQ